MCREFLFPQWRDDDETLVRNLSSRYVKTAEKWPFMVTEPMRNGEVLWALQPDLWLLRQRATAFSIFACALRPLQVEGLLRRHRPPIKVGAVDREKC